jgi:hypothetical protein
VGINTARKSKSRRLSSALIVCCVSSLLTGTAIAGAGTATSNGIPVGPSTTGGNLAQSASNLVWTYASGGESWIGRTVALGNQGEHVFSEFEGFQGSTRMFAAQDANPPTPLWQSTLPYMSYSSKVDAAETANVQVALRFNQAASTASRVPVLSRYTSNSAAANWTYSFPFTVTNSASGVHVSRNGQTIVAWVYDYSSLKTAVAVFGPSSSTPRSYNLVYTAGMPLSGELSADGSTLLLVAAIKTIVFNATSGAVSYELFNTQTLNLGHAISGDGSVFALSGSQRQVMLYKKQGTTYQPWFTHVLEADAACSTVALSDDSSTLVCGFNYGSPFLQVRTHVLDLRAPTHPVVFDESVTGGGTMMNVITDVDVSADGSAVAVGLSGDQQGLAPELLVYGKNAQSGAWSRLFGYDLPGSVNDVDISADGRRVAVASKAVHMSVAGNGGRLDLFGVTQTIAPSADIAVFGTANLGGTITFQQYLPAGTSAMLLRSPSLAAVPQVFAGIGTLYLERSTTRVAASGIAGSNGVFETQVIVPMNAALVGRTFYFQGLSTLPDKLSHDWVSVTIQP